METPTPAQQIYLSCEQYGQCLQLAVSPSLSPPRTTYPTLISLPATSPALSLVFAAKQSRRHFPPSGTVSHLLLGDGAGGPDGEASAETRRVWRSGWRLLSLQPTVRASSCQALHQHPLTYLSTPPTGGRRSVLPTELLSCRVSASY